MNPEDSNNTEVQHVVATRADSSSAVVESPAEGTSTLLSSGGRAFFTTLKRMLLLALVLSLAAAWWAEEGSIPRGVGAAFLVFIPVAVVSLVLATQRAAVAIAVETFRRTGLTRMLLDLLLNEVSQPDKDDPTPATRLPIGEACLRLKVAITAWKAKNTVPSALIRRSQGWVGGLIEKILSAAFQSYVGKGGVDLNEVRQDLATRIDDLVADRVRKRTRLAVAGAIIASVCWAVLVAYTLHRLAHA